VQGYKYTVVPAEPKHIWELAPNLEKAQIDEIYQADGSTPHEALAWPLSQPDAVNFAGLNEHGKCIAMFGVRPTHVPNSGTIYFLNSDELKNRPLTVVKMCLKYLPVLCKDYDLLHNFVDTRYTQARKWLKLLGFKEQMITRKLMSGNVPFVLMTYEVNK
tara:strand:+ start:1176 stop:1655 length:480 start_codon:yes stop_codon:yes gene_type:complete